MIKVIDDFMPEDEWTQMRECNASQCIPWNLLQTSRTSNEG